MPIEFDIQVVNGCVKITVGGGQVTGTTADQGGNSPGGQSGHTPGGSGPGNGQNSPGGHTGHTPGGSGPGSGGGGGCCGPVVIGPIVVDASTMQSGMPGQNQQGGNSPGGSSGHTGGGGPGSGQSSPGSHTGHTPSGQPGHPPGGGPGQNSPGGPSGHTGGGGPVGGGLGGASGSGCWCPVVIGPIVIGGCSASQGPASSIADGGSKAVCVNPPAQSEAAGTPTVPFTMQTQQATNWCWAAVAVSVYDFFNPNRPSNTGVAATSTIWTQGTLANRLLGITAPGCSQTPIPGSCNQTGALDTALALTKNLMPNGALFGQHFTFACIQSWVKAQLPLGVRIQWRGLGGHFIALDGCKVLSSGRQLVHVQDPSGTAHALHSLWDYDALVEDYREAGYWDSTYLVTIASKPTS
jgi:hypothetical protein